MTRRRSSKATTTMTTSRPAGAARENEILDWARTEWGDREDEE